jgi:deoxyribose-phosphate aldolase
MKDNQSEKNTNMTQPQMSLQELAQKIDHTLLKPVITGSELKKLCDEAAEHHFKTVCIPPCWVKEAVGFLTDTSVDVITVIGFPLGYSHTRVKVFEAEVAIEQGSKEIDMVLNLSLLKSARLQEMGEDVRNVKRAIGGIPLKVILETAYLSDAEKIEAAKICERAGADFIKTSTGFAVGGGVTGATLADIELLRKTLKPGTKIKASGGIRDFEGAVALINAGADRLGTSSGVQILKGLTVVGNY